MALEIKETEDKPSKAKAAKPVKAASAPDAPMVKIVLATANRYMRGTKMYTAEVIYSCDQEQALEMLSWTDELDNAIFKRYKKAVTKAEIEERESAPREESIGGVKLSAAAPAKAARIDIGDDDELEGTSDDETDDESGVEV